MRRCIFHLTLLKTLLRNGAGLRTNACAILPVCFLNEGVSVNRWLRHFCSHSSAFSSLMLPLFFGNSYILYFSLHTKILVRQKSHFRIFKVWTICWRGQNIVRMLLEVTIIGIAEILRTSPIQSS